MRHTLNDIPNVKLRSTHLTSQQLKKSMSKTDNAHFTTYDANNVRYSAPQQLKALTCGLMEPWVFLHLMGGGGEEEVLETPPPFYHG